MIFLDTSGIYALADRDDAKHDEAVRSFQAAGRSGERFLTHSYVLVESAALIQRRLGLAQALSFLREVDKFIVRWVLPELHSEAVDYLARAGKARLSLVDAASIVIMRREGVEKYLGFDGHFSAEGFQEYRA